MYVYESDILIRQRDISQYDNACLKDWSRPFCGFDPKSFHLFAVSILNWSDPIVICENNTLIYFCISFFFSILLFSMWQGWYWLKFSRQRWQISVVCLPGGSWPTSSGNQLFLCRSRLLHAIIWFSVRISSDNSFFFWSTKVRIEI